MITYPWPIGTVHLSELPPDLRTAFSANIDVEGYVADWLLVHRTATEGPYIEFSGYKIRVMIEDITPSTYRVRIA
jgi:hypothetical protein